MSKEQTIELDEAAVAEIAKHVQAPEIDYDKVAEKLAEIQKANEKEVNKLKTEKKEAVEGEIVGKYAKESKEEFAVKQLIAAMSGNTAELAERNAHALKTLKEAGMVEKASYLNAGTGADGGYLVPNNELLADVMNILSDFSVLAGAARVINLTTGGGIDVSTLTADVIMTEVGSEGGAKTVTKPTFGDTTIDVREWAGVAVLTKKVVRQAVVDVYAILRDSFARAIAHNREELLLTDATSGIVHKSGIVSVSLVATKTSVDDFDWATIRSLPFKVPVKAARGGMYVFSRLLAAHLDGLQSSTGYDLDLLQWDPGSNLTGTTKNGYRFVVAESLGTTDAVDTAYCVFGNFGQYAIVVRQGAVDSAVFDSGIVTDGSSVDHNLIQENKLALRVESWENVGYPLPGAFVVAKTAAS